MAVTMILKKARNTAAETASPDVQRADWLRYVAGGSLVAGACLLLTGRRRAGMVMAASGTAIALLDQQDTLRRWWGSVPRYLDQAQSMVDRVQEVVKDLGEKGETVRRVLTRKTN